MPLRVRGSQRLWLRVPLALHRLSDSHVFSQHSADAAEYARIAEVVTACAAAAGVARAR